MASPLIATTLQAAALAALSNLVAQLIKRDTSIGTYGTHLDFAAIIRFALFSLVSTPPNIKWQEYLEGKFPGSTTTTNGKVRTNKLNTAKKVVLDQTVGAIVNSAAFILFFAFVDGAKDPSWALMAVKTNVFGLVVAGWKLWPAVSLLNFAVVPLESRVLVNSLVGLFWGVYLSMLTS